MPEIDHSANAARVRNLLISALTAASHGWHVFPLRPHDKRPARPDHSADQCRRTDPRCRSGHSGWEARATTDPDRITRAWQCSNYNVGIACGPSGLVVIDLDIAKEGQCPPMTSAATGVRDGGEAFAALCERARQPFPDTYTVTTASGGTHLYFRHPAGPQLRNTQGATGNGLGWLIDTRAHGGYVVGAGSTVRGRPYRVLNQRSPIELPEWLAAALTPVRMRPAMPTVISVPSDRVGRYVQAAVNRTVAKLGGAAEGGRNTALYMAAQSLGQLAAGGLITEGQVTAALTPTARELGLSARETSRTIRSGLAAGARNPRKIA